MSSTAATVWAQVRRPPAPELHQPHAVWVAVQDGPGYLERQPCLATATHARQGQEPRGRQPRLHIRQLALPANETGERGGQVVAHRAAATHR